MHPAKTLIRHAVVAALAVAHGAAADSITMRNSVRLASDAPAVTLGDVATLDGPLAAALADVVVRPRPERTVEIDVAEVRRVLEGRDVHWGKVHLAGRRTIVRPPVGVAAAAPLAMSAVSLAAPAARGAVAAEAAPATPGAGAETLAAEATLRGAAARAVIRALDLDPARLRLDVACDDPAALDMPAASWRFELRPLADPVNDRFDVSARAWRDGRVQGHWILRVRPTVRSEVLVATRDIARGRDVADDDLAPEARWLTLPDAEAAAERGDAVGRPTTARVRAGTVLRRDHLQRPEIVRRGDLVMVRCVVGGLVIAVKAEARASAALGDVIELRKIGERETFTAVVTGRGEAVVELDARRRRPATDESPNEET